MLPPHRRNVPLPPPRPEGKWCRCLNAVLIVVARSWVRFVFSTGVPKRPFLGSFRIFTHRQETVGSFRKSLASALRPADAARDPGVRFGRTASGAGGRPVYFLATSFVAARPVTPLSRGISPILPITSLPRIPPAATTRTKMIQMSNHPSNRCLGFVFRIFERRFQPALLGFVFRIFEWCPKTARLGFVS